MLQTPIAFVIFNRPDTTEVVFDSIRQARPKELFVIGDGHRSNVEGEEEKVERARKVIQRVDWDCDVRTCFSNENLGCKYRVATGLDWAFSQSDRLIILEDDCVPDPSFFSFCEELLERFEDEQRVMMISGDNFQDSQPKDLAQPSYYFSRWSHIWGWASWRRAWTHFDVDVKSWPDKKMTSELRHWFDSEEEYLHWEATLDRQHAGQIDTWDFPWQYACWANGGMTILPNVNLVSNIGFRADATHTVNAESRLAALPTGRIQSIKHPEEIELNRTADRNTWETIFRPQPAATTKIRKSRGWLKQLFSGVR